MPTTVKKLFDEFAITGRNRVNWKAKFVEDNHGIYIVSTSPDPEKHIGISSEPLFNSQQIQAWINKVPGFKIDGIEVNQDTIQQRLKSFWLPDESILYIGKAERSTIDQRVNQYYTTAIGSRSPHKGGQWLKTLEGLPTFTVYYGSCDNSGTVEKAMLDYFMANVSAASLSKVYDPQKPLPFANILHRGRKKHGFTKQYI